MRVDLYQDIKGEYFPILLEPDRWYRPRPDGKVEEFIIRKRSTRGKVVNSLRGRISDGFVQFRPSVFETVILTGYGFIPGLQGINIHYRYPGLINFTLSGSFPCCQDLTLSRKAQCIFAAPRLGPYPVRRGCKHTIFERTRNHGLLTAGKDKVCGMTDNVRAK